MTDNHMFQFEIDGEKYETQGESPFKEVTTFNVDNISYIGPMYVKPWTTKVKNTDVSKKGNITFESGVDINVDVLDSKYIEKYTLQGVYLVVFSKENDVYIACNNLIPHWKGSS